MTIRTWVAWNKNRSLKYALPILYISVWTSIFAIVCIFLRTEPCQHWVFLISFFDHQLLTSAFFVLFFSVDPTPLNPYPRCHLLRSDPMMFVGWVLFLFYDTGADWHHTKRNVLKECVYSSDADINGHSGLENLWARFNIDSTSQFLKCIIQIACKVEPLSWRLYTETVGLISFTPFLFIF